MKKLTSFIVVLSLIVTMFTIPTAAVETNNNGTLDSPVAINQKHTWTEKKDYLGDTISATYSLTVKKVTKISDSELNALGFKKEESDGKYEYEYALVDLAYEVKDASITKVKGKGTISLSAYSPYFWGIKTADGISGLMGIKSSGFDGSFSKAVSDATKSKKVTPGIKESFKTDGKILIVLLKGKTNYLTIRNNEIEDYKNSFIYFNLKYSGESSSKDEDNKKQVDENQVISDEKEISTSENKAADGDGTFNSPVSMNQKHTWTEKRDYLGDTISASYSVTVKNVKKLSSSELKDLGFKEGESDGKYEYEYALIDLVYEVKNAAVNKGTGKGSLSLSSFTPYLWGIKTADGISGLMGIRNYGFDGSMSSTISGATKSKKVTPGMKEEYKAEGKVLAVLIKGKTNYLVFRNQETKDYKSSFIYFKLT